MAAKTIPNKPKKGITGLFVKVAGAMAAVSLIVSLVSGQMQVASMQRELDAKNEQLHAQAVENQEMISMMESGNEDAYIERIAREKLGYAYPDEQVFIDISGE